MDLTLRASNNHATVGSYINASHSLVMALELVLEYKLGAGLLVQFDIVVSCNRKGLAVGGEGMIGNRVVEKMVDFRTRHDGRCWLR